MHDMQMHAQKRLVLYELDVAAGPTPCSLAIAMMLIGSSNGLQTTGVMMVLLGNKRRQCTRVGERLEVHMV